MSREVNSYSRSLSGFWQILITWKEFKWLSNTQPHLLIYVNTVFQSFHLQKMNRNGITAESCRSLAGDNVHCQVHQLIEKNTALSSAELNTYNNFTTNARHIISVLIFGLWYFEEMSQGKSFAGMLICCFSDHLHMYHIIITTHMLLFSRCHFDNRTIGQFIFRLDSWNKVHTSKWNQIG